MADQANLRTPLSPVRQYWMPTEQAIEQYLAYEERYGRGHALLACHAAFPLIVTPELVNLIRLNFLADQAIDWVAEADFLLAFCHPIDTSERLYQIDPGLREVMLADLEESIYGIRRLYELADFLVAYSERYTEPLRRPDIACVQQWIACSYLHPQKVIDDIKAVLLAENNQGIDGIHSPSYQLHVALMIEVMRDTFEIGPPTLEQEYKKILETSRIVTHYWFRSKSEREISTNAQYQEALLGDVNLRRKITSIRKLAASQQDVTNADESMNSMMTDVSKDRVFVFTPQGDTVDLPAGSTPIDFAYAIHTELGHRCRGANVSGRLVPLDYKLKNGEQVMVIAVKRGGPSRDWLNHIVTQHARKKIRAWFHNQGREKNVQFGRQMLEKEMRRLSVTLSTEALAKLFNYEQPEDFYAAIGYGDINSNQIVQTIFNQEQRGQERLAGLSGTLIQARFSHSTSKLAGGLMMQGVEGLLTRLGHCCNPIPGDPIIGYVTKGRGVTIHRTDCPNIATCIKRGQNHRLIDVQWTEGDQKTYPVRIQISAYDRSDLMRDISKLIADEHINMLSVEVLTGQKDNLALINATVEIEDVTQLMRLLTKIDRLPNIVDVRRTLS